MQTDLVLAVLEDLVVGLLVLFHSLLHLYGVDLDAVLLRCEVIVEAKHIVVLNLSSLPFTDNPSIPQLPRAT